MARPLMNELAALAESVICKRKELARTTNLPITDTNMIELRHLPAPQPIVWKKV